MLTALKTAEYLEKENIGATVIDLRTLKPFDKDTVFKSVLETGRVAFIQDPSPIGSVGSHILSVICQDKNCFKALKAEVLLIGGKCEPTPFSENLEKESIPSVEECLQRILKLF